MCWVHVIDKNLDREIDSDDVRVDLQWCENEYLQKTQCHVTILCEFSGFMKRLNYASDIAGYLYCSDIITVR